MYMICFGLQMLSVSMSYGVIQSDDPGCTGFVWLFLVGLLMIISPISAKTWAIYRVFSEAAKLRHFDWDSRRLFLVTVCPPLFACILYLSAWSVYDDGLSANRTSYHQQNDYVSSECALSESFVVPPALFLLLSLGYLSYLSFKARHVPSNWNESKYLGFTLFTFLLIIVFYLVLTLSPHFSEEPSSLWLLRSLCTFMLIQCVLFLLFYVKFMVIHGCITKEVTQRRHSDLVEEIEASNKSKGSMPETSPPPISKENNRSKRLRPTISLLSEREATATATATNTEIEGPSRGFKHVHPSSPLPDEVEEDDGDNVEIVKMSTMDNRWISTPL